MAFELLIAVLGIIFGFLIAYYIISRQKWGDKKDVLDAKWKNKFAEYKHQVEIRLEKMDKHMEVSKEKSKTELETVKKDWNVKYISDIEELKKILQERNKEWEIKYIKDIEELKKLFKESEQRIKDKSISSSRRSLVGKFIERFVPFLSKVEYAPSDMHFMGQPIDYIVFDGLRDDDIKKVVFLEVKTGEGKLTKREKSLKDAIERKKVHWKELRIDTDDEKTPDKEIEREESSIDDLYEHIDSKLEDVKKRSVTASESNDFNKVNEEYLKNIPAEDKEAIREQLLAERMERESRLK